MSYVFFLFIFLYSCGDIKPENKEDLYLEPSKEDNKQPSEGKKNLRKTLFRIRYKKEFPKKKCKGELQKSFLNEDGSYSKFSGTYLFKECSVLKKVLFSDNGGLSKKLNLLLSGAGNNELIRYTLDSTEPNKNSPVYKNSIAIETTTIVRAKIFNKENKPISFSESRSYLFGVSHDLPILSLVAEPADLFDKDIGIYVFGDSYNEKQPYRGANFWEDWERPAHISIYEADGSFEFSYNLGMKIFGSWSRINRQRSFSFFSRRKFGVGKIKYKLFPDLNYSSFESFLLRNSGQDWLKTSLKDAVLTSLLEGTGLDYQAYRPSVVYINGEYWGLYNIREKINEHFLASKYSVKTDEIDLLGIKKVPIHGKAEDYNKLISFLKRHDLSRGKNFKQIEEKIDIENYIIYQVAQIYFANHDWPHNNIKYWKSKKGKWKWILYDTDVGFFLERVSLNSLALALNKFDGEMSLPSATFVFRKLTKNISFRNRFINRYADELNSRFLPENFVNHFDKLYKVVKSEMKNHYDRWKPSLYSKHEGYIKEVKDFAKERPAYSRKHILEVFNLPSMNEVNLKINEPSMGEIELNNNLVINKDDWDGLYFETVLVSIRAKPKPGYMFSHWSSDTKSLKREDIFAIELNLDIKERTSLKANFISL